MAYKHSIAEKMHFSEPITKIVSGKNVGQ